MVGRTILFGGKCHVALVGEIQNFVIVLWNKCLVSFKEVFCGGKQGIFPNWITVVQNPDIGIIWFRVGIDISLHMGIVVVMKAPNDMHEEADQISNTTNKIFLSIVRI